MNMLNIDVRSEHKAAEFHGYKAAVSNDEPVDQVLARVTKAVRDPLAKVLSGGELGYDEAVPLANARGDDLDAMARVADVLRRETVGDATTFIVNRNINFTNICNIGCTFCAFKRPAKHAEAYDHDLDFIIAEAREAWELGATEICMQGGIDPEMDKWRYRDMLIGLKDALPSMHLHVYSPMEMLHGMRLTGLGAKEYALAMREAGQDTMPGTAAEILDDKVRGEISPKKITVEQWREIITAAHEVGTRSSSTMMYGHTEKPEDWVRHILFIRDLQKDTGGFTEFVPLGFIHDNTVLYKGGKGRDGFTRDESIAVHALSRVMLHGHIDNIQVSWVKLGLEGSLECLEAGANDFGGTLMEESISREAGADHGEYLGVQEFTKAVRSIDRTPALRSTTYSTITPLY